VSEPFVAEIRMWPGNFAPRAFAFCNGQILPISQNTALFSLIGTYYGGNGTSNFALPNLQGRIPLMAGDGNGLTPRSLGEQGGEPAVTLTQNEMPKHAHVVNGDDNGTGAASPANAIWSGTGRGGNPPYVTATPSVPMNPQALTLTGGSQPHNNMSPYLTVNFMIAMFGIFPARN